MSELKGKLSKDFEKNQQEAYENTSCGIIKNSSCKQRLCFSFAFVTFLAILSVLIWLVVPARKEYTFVNGEPPHEWFLTREMWDAASYEHNLTTEPFDPLKLVVIHHTVTRTCATFRECAETLRAIQRHALNTNHHDIPYNFLIGNDGRVYEGRGWGIQGAQRADFNRCTLLVAFIGDYRSEIDGHTLVTDAQVNRTRMLFAEGIRLGHLQDSFRVIGARDIMYTQSPGSILYEAIQEWEEYDHKNYRGLTCEMIYGIEEIVDDPNTWLVSRDMWQSRDIGNTPSIEPFDSLKLVVIFHSVTTECYSISACSTAMRNLQSSAINSGQLDVVYNFLIGNDGRVYEGRGWGIQGAQRADFNRCTLLVGFIGDYSSEIDGHTVITDAQINRARMLFAEGVRLGHLQDSFRVIGAKDITLTQSPGSVLYEAIQKWEEYDQDNYMGLTCEQIYGIEDDTDDLEPWLISRDTWESQDVGNIPSTEPFDPLKLVVIQHTVTTECYSISACSVAMRNLQSSAINSEHLDILYNFVIGNDGRVYEGRGWGKDGAQRFDFNRCSLNVGFIGDYRDETEGGRTKVTADQLNSARLLLAEGVKLGHLSSDFSIVGAKDLMNTASPGSNLYNAIQEWDDYDHTQSFYGQTCEEIYKMDDNY